MQGLFIFLFYVLLKEDMRKFWHQKIFRPKKNLGISSTGVDSKGMIFIQLNKINSDFDSYVPN